MSKKSIKRENGTGTVYKRSDLKRRPWVACVPGVPCVNDEGNVRYRQEVIGHYATAQEAKDALEDYRRAPTDRLNITVEQLHDEWQPIGYRDKSKQQCDCYNAAWGHLKPIYDIKFRDLRTAQMQRIIDALQLPHAVIRYGKEKMDPGMSFSSLSKIKILLGVLYKYAMQNDIVNKDYSKFIVLPKNETGLKDRFTDMELAKIEKAVGVVPFADCILMMCYTGYRISEFLLLTKFNVHERNGHLGLIGGIKTEAGEDRLIPVHPKIEPLFRAWLAKDGDRIICSPDGKPYNSKYFREECYYPALEQIGVRRLTPHATRRTFSTRGSANGMRQEDLIALMGHTDFSVDIESYINQEFDTLYKAINMIP